MGGEVMNLKEVVGLSVPTRGLSVPTQGLFVPARGLSFCLDVFGLLSPYVSEKMVAYVRGSWVGGILLPK